MTVITANTMVEEYFQGKNLSNNFIRFLAKNIDTDSSFIINKMLENHVKQNIIEYFVRFKFHLHEKSLEIVNHLIQMKQYNDISGIYLFACLKKINHIIAFELLSILVLTAISIGDIKSLMKNLSEKLKCKNEEKMMYLVHVFKYTLNYFNNTVLTFTEVTKQLHMIIDVLEKSNSLKEVYTALNFCYS
jgi:hypothetical protein